MLAIKVILVEDQHSNPIRYVQPRWDGRIVGHPPAIAPCRTQRLRVEELNTIRHCSTNSTEGGVIAVSAHLDRESVKLHPQIRIQYDLTHTEAQVQAVNCRTVDCGTYMDL